MRTSSQLFIVIVTLSFFLLSGCVTQQETMIEQGYPLTYAEGFDDGCHSGHKAGGNMFEHFKKDVQRFESDNQYASGWSDGFRQCETEEEAIQRQVRMSIEQQKLIEQRKQNKLQAEYHLEHQAIKGVDTSNFKYLSK